MEETILFSMDDERQALLRQYAKGEVTWHELQERGFNDYVEVLAGLGELGLRPPIAPLEGPNREARERGRAIIRRAADPAVTMPSIRLS
jgi:hypothetical protein